MSDEIRFRQVATNGVSLNVAEAGPETGPLLILLHGFPENWSGWRNQLGPLARAGYRVVAPDQRGYGASEKPPGVASYRLDHLVDDLIGLASSYGRGPVSVAGHDWGGIVAWAAIERHPDRFDRAVILNAPHPGVMQQALKKNLRQLLRSWYAFFFQLPWIPEFVLKRNNFRLMERLLVRSSRPGAFSQADLELLSEAWGQPGALRSMIHWYRASFRTPKIPLPDSPISVPTLIIWGVKDQALGPGLARSSFAQCRHAKIEWIDDATHWVAREQPDLVNKLMLEFLNRGERSETNPTPSWGKRVEPGEQDPKSSDQGG